MMKEGPSASWQEKLSVHLRNKKLGQVISIRRRRALDVLLTAVLCASTPCVADAQIGQDFWGDCRDIEWSDDVLRAHPNIEDYCLDIVERGRKPFVLMRARIVRQAPNITVVQWLGPDGAWSDGQSIYYKLADNAEIAEQGIRITDLAPRQEINLLVPVGGGFDALAQKAQYPPLGFPMPSPPPAPPSIDREAFLKYDADVTAQRKQICLDLAILYSSTCDSPECISPNEAGTIREILEHQRAITVYPVYDPEQFVAASKSEVEAQRWCKNARYFGEDTTERILLFKCDDPERIAYACSDNRVLLEFVGDSPTVSLNLILVDSAANNFIDAVNIKAKLELDEQGAISSVSALSYNKIASVTFPKQTNRHTLVVLKDPPYFRLALITRADDGALLLSSWKQRSKNIDDVLLRKLTNIFNNTENLRKYGDDIRKVVMASAPPNRISQVLSDQIVCAREKVEVVYPNDAKDEIRPITVEYIPLVSNGLESRFAGDCYLVSHRPRMEHLESARVNELHFYLASENVDSVISDLNEHMLKMLKADEELQLEVDCESFDNNSFVSGQCSDDVVRIVKAGQETRVFWHKKLPLEDEFLPQSIVVFNSHQDVGGFRFDNDREVSFVGSIGGIVSPNYMLNSCGNAQQKTIEEIVVDADYRNLIYANKEITSQEAAINLYCAVREFSSNSEHCIPMSAWVSNLQHCMRDHLGGDSHKALAYHFIGQMDDEICPD